MSRALAAAAALVVTFTTVWSVATAAYPAPPATTLAARPVAHCHPG